MHTVQSNTKTFLTDPFDPLGEPKQVLLLPIRVDLGVMGMKVFSIFSRSSGMGRHNKMQCSVIPKTPFFFGEEGSYSSAEDTINSFTDSVKPRKKKCRQ